MAAEQDFVIDLRTIFKGDLLHTYFGKIGGICQSGNRLSTREGLIEIVIDEETYPYVEDRRRLFYTLSAFGTNCAFKSEDDFRRMLARTAAQMSSAPPAKKKGGRRTKQKQNRSRKTRTSRRQSRRR
jgi:hypothetical protein